MKLAICTLRSVSPYGQGRYIDRSQKSLEETDEMFEQRTWRQRCHVDKHGIVYIPPMVFKKCLTEAASYLGMKVPGKGNSKYLKHFKSGIMCTEPLSLGVKVEDMLGLSLMVSSKGQRGGGTRVQKTFPYVESWSGDLSVMVLDELITEEVFAKHLEVCGKFIGIGFSRPANDGYWGRFLVEQIQWQNSSGLTA